MHTVVRRGSKTDIWCVTASYQRAVLIARLLRIDQHDHFAVLQGPLMLWNTHEDDTITEIAKRVEGK